MGLTFSQSETVFSPSTGKHWPSRQRRYNRPNRWNCKFVTMLLFALVVVAAAACFKIPNSRILHQECTWVFGKQRLKKKLPVFFSMGHGVMEGLSGGGTSSLRKEKWTEPGRAVNIEAVSKAGTSSKGS